MGPRAATFAVGLALISIGSSGCGVIRLGQRTMHQASTLPDLHYQQVLDGVTFNSPSHNPTDYGSAPTRLVTWTVNDGAASHSTASATSTINITAVNDPPTLAGTGNASFTENGSAVTLAGTASVSDPDDLNQTGCSCALENTRKILLQLLIVQVGMGVDEGGDPGRQLHHSLVPCSNPYG